MAFKACHDVSFCLDGIRLDISFGCSSLRVVVSLTLSAAASLLCDPHNHILLSESDRKGEGDGDGDGDGDGEVESDGEGEGEGDCQRMDEGEKEGEDEGEG